MPQNEHFPSQTKNLPPELLERIRSSNDHLTGNGVGASAEEFDVERAMSDMYTGYEEPVSVYQIPKSEELTAHKEVLNPTDSTVTAELGAQAVSGIFELVDTDELVDL